MAQYVIGWAVIVAAAAFIGWVAIATVRRPPVRYRCGGCHRLYRHEEQAVACVLRHFDEVDPIWGD